ncbi:MAG TPA: vitamin B12 dependent-methionine synthase activation domain-containing protein, partial [Ignavibacteriaceae bacterium]
MESSLTLKHSILKKFKFNYDDCAIFENYIVELLGYDVDNVPEPVLETIKFLLDRIPEKVSLQSGYKIFNPKKVKLNGDSFFIDNRLFNCGKIIYSSLKNSETIAFLISSIGEEVELWSKHFMDNNEMLKGYLIDKIASELVEQLADKTELMLEDELKEIELEATNRYSPGYCGWSVADQQNLFSLLPAKFCGVSVNDNSMMIPIKSVSAVIGVGKNVEKKNYECSICEI